MTDLELPIGRRTATYRALEMLPAVLSYSILFLPAILSIWSSFWAAVFVIVYIIAWTVKALGMAARTIQGYQTMQKAQQIDWSQRLADLTGRCTAGENVLAVGRLPRVICVVGRRGLRAGRYLSRIIIPAYNSSDNHIIQQYG
jgi:hypothetical protein